MSAQVCRFPQIARATPQSKLKTFVPVQAAQIVKRAASQFEYESSQIIKLNYTRVNPQEDLHVLQLAKRKDELLKQLYQTAIEIESINTQQLALAGVFIGQEGN